MRDHHPKGYSSRAVGAFMLRAVSVLCFLGLCVAAFGQSITYTHGEYPSKGFPGTQADMNGDGILDMVTTGTGPTGKFGFYVTLSNPDGSYQTPTFYTVQRRDR